MPEQSPEMRRGDYECCLRALTPAGTPWPQCDGAVIQMSAVIQVVSSPIAHHLVMTWGILNRHYSHPNKGECRK
jgi:hypothetical protein